MPQHLAYLSHNTPKSLNLTLFFSKQGLALNYSITIRLFLMTFQRQIPVPQLASSPNPAVPDYVKEITVLSTTVSIFWWKLDLIHAFPFFCLAHTDHQLTICFHSLSCTSISLISTDFYLETKHFRTAQKAGEFVCHVSSRF